MLSCSEASQPFGKRLCPNTSRTPSRLNNHRKCAMCAKLARFATEMASIFLSVLGIAAVLALALKMLDLAPEQIERMRGSFTGAAPVTRVLRFGSVEEAQSQLRVAVLTPIYFPDYLVWPAAYVYAQREPLTVTSIFRSSDLREGLTIRQGYAKTEGLDPLLPQPAIVIRRSTVLIGQDREGVLIEGKDGDGTPRNQLYWRMDGVQIDMVTRYSVDELLRMAQSMRPQGAGDRHNYVAGGSGSGGCSNI